MSEHVCDELRKLDPASLRVQLLDGTVVPVAVPKIRNRWQRVYKVLDSLAWTRVDALDKSGAVLGSVEDEDAGGYEPDPDVDGGDRDMRIARVLLEVMRSTQKETRQMFETQMRGQAELVDALIGGVKSISQSYEQSMAVQRAQTVAESASASGNPEMMALFQLALSQLNQPKLPVPTKGG